MLAKWYTYFLRYNPENTWKQLRVPVLVLNGELDLVVSPTLNLPAIAQALDTAKNSDYTIKVLPRLNHAFQTCTNGSDKEYAFIEETTSPLALHEMTQWIQERSNKD